MPRQSAIEQEFITRIRKHQGILHKICAVYGKTEADREDLTQEMVLQLWKSYPSFQGRSEFSTWMYRVALNTAISSVKKPSLLSEEGENLASTIDYERELEHSEELRILYRAIAQLNKVEKAIILMWLDEKSYQEIADTMGISEKNVSVKLVRIKAKLAARIEKLQ